LVGFNGYVENWSFTKVLQRREAASRRCTSKVFANDLPSIRFLCMKHSDVGTVEVVLNTEESVICKDALG
jgi:hypothetical protein